MSRRLRIGYLLDSTELSGAARVVLAQADALISRQHEVVIFTTDLPLTWRNSLADWKYVDDFASLDASEFDGIVAPSWTTAGPALGIAGERAVHLSHGYEGSVVDDPALIEEIDNVYRLPLPKIVVAPHLVNVLRRLNENVTHIGQVVDSNFFRLRPQTEHLPLRLLIVGPSQVEAKGIDVAYQAAMHARWFGATFDIVRVSPWAPSREEPLDEVTEFHVAINNEQMTRLMHSCDLYLGASRPAEGFGLPAAEALASSIPSVLTAIPSYLGFDAKHDFALFAESEDAEALGDQLLELIAEEELRGSLARRGRQVAEQFRAHRVAERLEKFFLDRSRR